MRCLSDLHFMHVSAGRVVRKHFALVGLATGRCEVWGFDAALVEDALRRVTGGTTSADSDTTLRGPL